MVHSQLHRLNSVQWGDSVNDALAMASKTATENYTIHYKHFRGRSLQNGEEKVGRKA
jgi:hypothetical protein